VSSISTRLSDPPGTRSALALLLGVFAQSATACQVTGVTVNYAMGPLGNGSSVEPYTEDEVAEALLGYGAFALDANGDPIYLWPQNTTYACVDARGSDDVSIDKFQVPGGDISELAMGITIFGRVMNITNMTQENIMDVLVAFANYTITEERPFYYHTDQTKLNYAFDMVYELVNQTGAYPNFTRPVVLPFSQPEDPQLAAIWYQALTYKHNQGCGHVRLTMTYPTEYYGLTEDEESILPDLVESFYKWWWPTEYNSTARRLAYYSILPGPLVGRAVTAIDNAGPGCPGQYPEVVPFHGGSTQFIYQGAAQATFQAEVMTGFFEWYAMEAGMSGFNSTEFSAQLNELSGTQLGATLTYLSPVDGLPVYSATVDTEESPEATETHEDHYIESITGGPDSVITFN